MRVSILRPNEKPKKDTKLLMEVFRRAWLYIAFLFVACVQHNMIFPGVMLKKPVSSMPEHTKTVSMIATYNISAIVGKKIGQYRKFYNKYTVGVIVGLRFGIVLLFIVQAVTVSIPILNTDWFGYANIALHGLTMGFVVVAGFILAPEAEILPNKKEIAGFLSVFAINIGTMLGGFVCLFFKDLSLVSPVDISDDSSKNLGFVPLATSLHL